jgi:outer membrane protein TolC
VAIALSRNDRLITSSESIAQADLAERLARSGFHPKVTPNILGSFGQSDVTNQTYRLDVSQKLPTGTELRASVGTATDRNQLGTYYSTDTTFSISQPLLRGFGRNVARRSLTSAEVRAAQARRDRVTAEQQVTVEVASAYYRIVSQQEMVSVAEKALERSRELLEASKAKLEVGKVSQLDVFRAEQLVAGAETQALDAQAAVEDAMDQLRMLLRRGPEYQFGIEYVIPKVSERVDLDEAIETALATRLELTSATEALAEAERNVAYNRNQLLPQLDLNLALTRREVADSFKDSFALNHFDFATFFAISMPVDRTPQTIQYHSAQIERNRHRREMEMLRMRIVEEVRRAVRQMDRLIKGLAVARASEDFAEKEVEVATLRYQRGLSNNLDVVNAEQALMTARSRRIGLLAEMAVARLSLLNTLGTLDPRRDVVGLDEER